MRKTPKTDFRWIDENEYDLANPLEVEANAVIALKLRRYMKTRGLTQKEMAEKLSVTPQYVGKLLSGKENLGIGTALKYGQALGTDLITMPSIEDRESKPIHYTKIMVVGLTRGPSPKTLPTPFPVDRISGDWRINSHKPIN